MAARAKTRSILYGFLGTNARGYAHAVEKPQVTEVLTCSLLQRTPENPYSIDLVFKHATKTRTVRGRFSSRRPNTGAPSPPQTKRAPLVRVFAAPQETKSVWSGFSGIRPKQTRETIKKQQVTNSAHYRLAKHTSETRTKHGRFTLRACNATSGTASRMMSGTAAHALHQNRLFSKIGTVRVELATPREAPGHHRTASASASSPQPPSGLIRSALTEQPQ